MKRSEIFFTVILIPVDFLFVFAGFMFAYYLRANGLFLDLGSDSAVGSLITYGSLGEIMPISEYIRYLFYITPAMLVIFALTGLYAMRGSMPWSKRIARILLGLTSGLFLLLLLFLLRDDYFIPRATVIYGWFFSALFVIFGRFIVRLIQALLRKVGIGVVRLGIIGNSSQVQQIMKSLRTHPIPLHRLDFQAHSIELDSLLKQIDRKYLDELILVNRNYSTEDLLRIRNRCLEQQVTFNFVPALFAALSSSNFAVHSEVGLPVIEIMPTPLEGWSRVVKRIFDILGSIFFIIIFSPLFLLIALWIKSVSPGPLIYKNIRLGKDMEPIKVWKFRSLKIEYCSGPGYNGEKAFKKYLDDNPEAAREWQELSKLKNDPRISGVGKFLRRTSLDELPQLFNVLIGTLSLVGPRPIVRNELNDEVAKYGEAARLLFTVKPGMTGLWQVSGRNSVSFEERIALDLDYIENWSLWWDLWILVQTIGVFFPKADNEGY